MKNNYNNKLRPQKRKKYKCYDREKMKLTTINNNVSSGIKATWCNWTG